MDMSMREQTGHLPKETLLGIDIGSVTISLVSMDLSGKIQKTMYLFHKGQIRECLRSASSEFDLANLRGLAACSASCFNPVKMENVKELEKEKCAKCGKKMFYCDQCRNCGLTFAHPDIPPLPSGAIENVFGPTHLATCPACSSADIRGF